MASQQQMSGDTKGFTLTAIGSFVTVFSFLVLFAQCHGSFHPITHHGGEEKHHGTEHKAGGHGNSTTPENHPADSNHSNTPTKNEEHQSGHH
jgi:hypothetical protein